MYDIKILFICMGNICRSPAAEGVMRKLIYNNNLQDRIYVDSAGTIGYHTGECADDRMLSRAGQRGYDLSVHRARSFNPDKDFMDFDLILTMDNANYKDIVNADIKSAYKSKIFKITDFRSRYTEDEIPDPYYGGTRSFDYVLDLLEDSCGGLLEKLRNEINNKK